jgi:hypothetical protein
MKLQQRKELLAHLGSYMIGNDPEWVNIKHRAYLENNWFIPEFINLAVNNIATFFLYPSQLDKLAETYSIPGENPAPQMIGIVMAGNIPLVGFHDLLCVFLAGHYAKIKASSKDEVLITHLVDKMISWQPGSRNYFTFSAMLKNCDAYIATGSNNSSRYFEYYFSKYPHIIRKNRSSVAILNGHETTEELEALADDVYQYFGLGCRNVTKIFVPQEYNFQPLLLAFRKYDHLADYHKYKNNYDYNLAVYMLNNRYYMTNGSILLVEDTAITSPISQLNYEYYTNESEVRANLLNNDAVQCVVGKNNIPFGGAQCPGITDYADGEDTMNFLLQLPGKKNISTVNEVRRP